MSNIFMSASLHNYDTIQAYPLIRKLSDQKQIRLVGTEITGPYPYDLRTSLENFKVHNITHLIIDSKFETNNPVIEFLKNNGIQVFNEKQLDKLAKILLICKL